MWVKWLLWRGLGGERRENYCPHTGNRTSPGETGANRGKLREEDPSGRSPWAAGDADFREREDLPLWLAWGKRIRWRRKLTRENLPPLPSCANFRDTSVSWRIELVGFSDLTVKKEQTHCSAGNDLLFWKSISDLYSNSKGRRKGLWEAILGKVTEKDSAVCTDTWDQDGGTQERSAEQIWPETLIKIKLLKENEVQDMDLKGGKEDGELKWSHRVTHAVDKRTKRREEGFTGDDRKLVHRRSATHCKATSLLPQSSGVYFSRKLLLGHQALAVLRS